MEIKFIEYGESLGTRACAKEILSKFENDILNESKMIFNFNEVSILSYSFVDELIGKLIRKYGLSLLKEKISFKEVNKFNERIILKVINENIN